MYDHLHSSKSQNPEFSRNLGKSLGALTLVFEPFDNLGPTSSPNSCFHGFKINFETTTYQLVYSILVFDELDYDQLGFDELDFDQLDFYELDFYELVIDL